MARSAGDNPRSASAHASRVEVDSATWKTGTLPASSGDASPAPLPLNAVALTMAFGA